MDEIIILVVACIVIGAPVVGVTYVLEEKQCTAQWNNSGMESRYSFFGGCQIKTAKGVWIPAKNYRDQDGN